MLQVKTYLDKSPIDGIGVFAGEDIKKGQVIWQLVFALDKIIEPADTLSLVKYATKTEKDFLNTYSYFDKQLQKWIIPADNDRFTNHSLTPNSIPNESGYMIAARDIKKGEEITANYYDIDEFANEKI